MSALLSFKSRQPAFFFRTWEYGIMKVLVCLFELLCILIREWRRMGAVLFEYATFLNDARSPRFWCVPPMLVRNLDIVSAVLCLRIRRLPIASLCVLPWSAHRTRTVGPRFWPRFIP